MLSLILWGLGGLLALAFLAVFVVANLPQPLDVVLPGAPIPRFRLIWILKAVGARLRIGGTSVERLQQCTVTARGIRVDPLHLAAYCALAGKTATEAQPGVALLPLSYLECVLFPLFIEVGVHRASPFGLLGSVHLRNSITMHRPIRSDEELDAYVTVDAITPAYHGYEIKMVARVYPAGTKGDGACIFECVTTVLAFHRHASGARPERTPWRRIADECGMKSWFDYESCDFSDDGDDEAGGPLAMRTLDIGETEGRAYAALTGDYNPIHVSNLGARLFGFKRAITHGMWVQAALEDALVNRNLFADLANGPVTIDVEFRRPIFLSSFVEMVVYPKDDMVGYEVYDDRLVCQQGTYRRTA